MVDIRLIGEDFTHTVDCILGIALPCDLRTLRHQIENPNLHDYVSRLHLISPSRREQEKVYQKKILEPMEMYIRNFRKLGVSVIENFGSQDLRVLPLNRNVVFILFAHWAHEGIELSDGLLAIDEFVNLVSPEFLGTFDLCVCHPKYLVRRLETHRPKIRAKKYIDYEATPLLWLGVYLVTFSILFQQKCLTYQMAIAKAVDQFNREVGLDYSTIMEIAQ